MILDIVGGIILGVLAHLAFRAFFCLAESAARNYHWVDLREMRARRRSKGNRP